VRERPGILQIARSEDARRGHAFGERLHVVERVRKARCRDQAVERLVALARRVINLLQ